MTLNRIRTLCVLLLVLLPLTGLHAEIIVPEGVEITETNLWTPFVETLRIRETPDLNGKVIATIKLGEQVEYIETSKNTSTVDFNGEKITDSWIKVKMKDGKIGWAWKSFMFELEEYKDKSNKFNIIIPKQTNPAILSINIIKKNTLDTQAWMKRYLIIEKKVINKHDDIKMILDAESFSDGPLILGILYEKESMMIIIKNNLYDKGIFQEFIKYFNRIYIDSEEYESMLINKITSSKEKQIICENSKIVEYGSNNVKKVYMIDFKNIKYEVFEEIIKKYNYYPQKVYISGVWVQESKIFINEVKNGIGNLRIQQWYCAIKIIYELSITSV